jgi:signal peptidase
MQFKLKKEQKDLIISVLIAVLLISSILGALYLYTGNWPPMVVVESGSMEHSATYGYFGDLNIGDIVLVKKVSSPSSIYTYVIIYKPFGLNTTPIIHRAIIYLQYNASGGGYNAPSLSLLPSSQWFVIAPSGKLHTIYDIKYNIEILNVGYTSTPVIIPVENMLQSDRYSGFVTMGDHNHAVYGEYATDQSLGISSLVRFSWVEGVATGYLPYLGIVKLFISGELPSDTPSNSIEAAAAIVVAIIAVPFAFEWFYERKK